MENIILVVVVLLIVWLIIKSSKGDFSYSEEIIEEGNLLDVNRHPCGKFYIIKRAYKNGRIEIKRVDL